MGGEYKFMQSICNAHAVFVLERGCACAKTVKKQFIALIMDVHSRSSDIIKSSAFYGYFIERSCVSLTVIGQYHEICQEHVWVTFQTKIKQKKYKITFIQKLYYITKKYFNGNFMFHDN